MTSLIVIAFVIGYIFIVLEFYCKVNKTTVGILLATTCWGILIFYSPNKDLAIKSLSLHLGEISQIIFFLVGAMTLVELIDSHKGFNIVLRFFRYTSKRRLLISLSIISFFLSSVLDNLTTTILMISILKKLLPNRKDRLIPLCLLIIAVNAGGAWTPIGDVTTTMLWIGKRISTMRVIRYLFIPSAICAFVPTLIYIYLSRGHNVIRSVAQEEEPGGKLVFWVGICALASVPITKWLIGLPPFMGMLLALGVLWLVTDALHYKYDDRKHLRVPFILTKIDNSSIMFFLGILLTIASLEVTGVLASLTHSLESIFPNFAIISIAIGVGSAIIDNVPIVAAVMSMYDLSALPMDSNFWLLTAFTAGTGGSILSIGSAAGVALMGLEKVTFIDYLRIATLPAMIGFGCGVATYIIFSGFW